MKLKVAILPDRLNWLEDGLRDQSLEVVGVTEADVLIWSALGGAEDLRALLQPRHKLVMILTAGAENLVSGGVIDEARVWTSARNVYAGDVAERALALLLGLHHRLGEFTRAGRWGRLTTRTLRGRTIGVLGTGGVGTALARTLTTLGAGCVGANSDGRAVSGFAKVLPAHNMNGFLASVDDLVIACPLTPATAGMIDKTALSCLPADAVVVNVSRGPIVDTDALVAALQSGRVAAAGLDVVDPEPLDDAHPLWSLPNVIVTSHTANPNAGRPWDYRQADVVTHLVENITRLSRGEPVDGLIRARRGY